ncbi:hypothetical protein FJT64_015713 [Amphibalanus amphitrite]|uniref:Redoxin domain-containing protein n=1 Tax=Amphibalanus amphitrite TaxID=1232801 RepID=A0A6A4X382_AMPAM|nr:hypothetical protein FJT64_015713 [Amphibalanus amphitrite]
MEAELERLRCAVLVVSFSDRGAVLRWLSETGCPFPVLLDPRRRLYTALGLPTDLQQVWSHAALLEEAERRLEAPDSPPLEVPYRGGPADPHQLGGDFLLDSRGRLMLSHPSTDPADRPTVQQLLDTLGRHAAGDQ